MYNTEERVNTEDFSRKVRIIAGWWFGTFFLFPIYWEQSPQLTDIFSEGLKPPTGIYIYVYVYVYIHM